MKTPPAAPYLLPPEDALAAEPWTTADGSELPERLIHWDPFTELDLARVIEVDLAAVRAACGLDGGSAFLLLVSWYSNRTRLSASGPEVILSGEDALLRASLSLRIPGTVSGGRLDLRTRLVLRHPGHAPSPISPRRVGATLWSEESRVALEGSASRFPVTAADFSSDGRFPDAAAWALEWDPEDFETPVLGGVRLLVNTNNSALLQALVSGSSDARAATIRSFVTFDVARSLVHGALASDRFVEDPHGFDDGTIGRMLSELLTMCWPGIPVNTLRARSIEDPARLDAELQAHLQVIA